MIMDIFRSLDINGNAKHIGRFKTEIEAAQARDAAAKLYSGEYARMKIENVQL
jgi:hypothetical protein